MPHPVVNDNAQRDRDIARRLEMLAGRLHTDSADDWTLLATATSMDLMQIAEVLRGTLRLEDCTFQGEAERRRRKSSEDSGGANRDPLLGRRV